MRTIVRASSLLPKGKVGCAWPGCPETNGLLEFHSLALDKVFTHCGQHHAAVLVLASRR